MPQAPLECKGTITREPIISSVHRGTGSSNKTKVATNRETRKAIDHEKKFGSSFIIDKKENLGVHFGVERKCVEKCVID